MQATEALISGFKTGKPLKSPQAGHEAVFASTGDDKTRQSLQALSNRPAGYRKAVVGLNCADDRVFVLVRSKENAVIDPLRLNELELTTEVRSDKREHQTAFDAVILENTVRQQWTVGRSSTDHAVNFGHTGNRCIARVCPAYVRPAGSFHTGRIILLKHEIVVAPRINA